MVYTPAFRRVDGVAWPIDFMRLCISNRLLKSLHVSLFGKHKKT